MVNGINEYEVQDVCGEKGMQWKFSVTNTILAVYSSIGSG